MHLRLHLVRFMYINLVLSCGFWLYDNVAAADATRKANQATIQVSQNVAAADVEAPSLLPTLSKLDTVTPGSTEADQVQIEILPNYKKVKKIAIESPTTQVADSNAVEHGTTPATTLDTPTSPQPRTSADGPKHTQNQLKDTSVVGETNNEKIALPLEAHIVNNNNDDISLVHNSEYINNNNVNNRLAAAANQQHTVVNDLRQAAVAAEVPNNQLNNVNSQVDNVNSDNLANKQRQQEQQTTRQDKFVADKAKLATEQQQKSAESFPEIITDLPTVTVTELPLEHVKNRLEAIILDELQQAGEGQQQSQSNKSEEQQPIFDNGKALPQKAEQVLKINDPGGGAAAEATAEAVSDASTGAADAPSTADSSDSIEAPVNSSATANLTAEEVPMPVFSEWAQKQMEAEASREQAMEQEQQVVNNSAQRRNATGTANGKPATLKLRSKNYASPDCGAKIIASNADATNTGAVLSHSSDEYMLSTCGSRIWFVVELCEAIQAQKVDLANFELFSSSPKNFTVAVSKRFSTRDWSNVGRFVAEDKRTVQTFELHPHLFGKFVRVDIHSHYSKEHFCPVSLFRVFGTSEFEAFETEIRPGDDLEDFDDDFTTQEQGHGKSGNIFQSASDAVMQMVKKAAEVLVKPTKAFRWTSGSMGCRTPTFGTYSCGSCNSTLVERVNSLLSCQFQQLQLLLTLPQLRADMAKTRVCAEEYGLGALHVAAAPTLSSGLSKQQSYYLSLLPTEHVGAICKLLEAEQNAAQGYSKLQPLKRWPAADEERALEQCVENVTTAKQSPELMLSVEAPPKAAQTDAPLTSTVEIVPETTTQQQPAALDKQAVDTTQAAATAAPTPADVNIFNVPAETEGDEAAQAAYVPTVSDTPTPTAEEPSDLEPAAATATATTAAPAAGEAVSSMGGGDVTSAQASGSGFEDSNPNNWENIDNLLTTTVASTAAAAAAVANSNGNLGIGIGGAGAAASNGAAGVNLQQKLTNGAQSESVFIRLSNRIKALERNMSLSGQYLEELSRRYKKQVEELQQTLTQQTLTVRTLEDQSRRYIEQEQLYQQQSAELAGEVRALTYQVQACIMFIIIVGTFIFVMLLLGTIYYRKLRRQTQHLRPPTSTAAAASKRQLNRRKSYEELPEQVSQKQRRPSEEAMLILKECGDAATAKQVGEPSENRQRKMSVFYGSNNNIANNMLHASARASLHKRKCVKHSWHSSLDAAVETADAESLDKFFDVDTLKSNRTPASKANKKKTQELWRQESAPVGCLTASTTLLEEEPTPSDFDEKLMLDDDGLANFIPNSDLAYNEFMPEGPSGYQIIDTVDGKLNKSEPAPTKKSRRLSSPAFFKSHFTKSKYKGGSLNGSGIASTKLKNSHSAHEATSWEWYRLKRNEKQQKQSKTNNGTASSSTHTSNIPNASLDSSSLSEISFPLNSTENSFRILGEAILSSGASSTATRHSNGNAASSSSSGGSTTSSVTKKKQRAFNSLFRKVF